MKKTTFVDRLLAELKGGDEAKLTRFSSKLEKYFSKQIQMRNDKIENLQDKVKDEQEALAEMVLKVNLERLASTDSVEGYCASYVLSITSQRRKIEALEVEIVDVQDEITDLQATQKAIFGESAE